MASGALHGPRDDLETCIRLINSDFGFDIPTRPSEKSSTRPPDAQKCYDQIRYLFYKDRTALDDIRDECSQKPLLTWRDFCIRLAGAFRHRTRIERDARRSRTGSGNIQACASDTATIVQIARPANVPETVENRRTKAEAAQSGDAPNSGETAFQHHFSFTSSQESSAEDKAFRFSRQGTGLTTACTSFNTSFHQVSRLTQKFLDNIQAHFPPHEVATNRKPPLTALEKKLSATHGDQQECGDTESEGDTEPDDDLDFDLIARERSRTGHNAVKDLDSTLEPHLLRSMPSGSLFVDDGDDMHLDIMALRVRFECTRVALSVGLPISFVASDIDPDVTDYSLLWNSLSKFTAHTSSGSQSSSCNSAKPTLPPQLSVDAWRIAATRDFCLSGSLHFNGKGAEQLFRLELHPFEPQNTSNRFFRKFGAHRFLRLEIPDDRELPHHVRGKFSKQHYARRLHEWLAVPNKKFMGRRWTCFQFQTSKRKKVPDSYPNKEEKHIFVAYLFATHGPSLETISVLNLWDWLMPLELNSNMKLLKAYSRLQLGFSDTWPTLIFSPDQVRFVQDIRADGAIDPGAFNDPDLDWSVKPAADLVMNDGCSRIAFAAARKIWDHLGSPTPLIPSVFQARIGPAKGVWIVEPQGNSEDIWIELSESQVKFQRHVEDRSLSSFDKDRLTFEVVNWSRKAVPGTLHLDQLSIMQDRGVSRNTFSSIVRGALEDETERFSTARSSSAGLRAWLQATLLSAPGASTNWTGDFPDSLGGSIAVLLESGFEADKCHYLNEKLHDALGTRLLHVIESTRVPIPLSTLVFGIADPYGCLAPDEIHLLFSKPFLDSNTGACFHFLDGVDALVTRQPALRVSDVQKVKCTFHKKLAHIRDVVVFPTTGSFPLGGKLQGGDYDGDTYWVCWDDRITKPFRNAPAPMLTLKPETYGIKVDRSTLASLGPSRGPTHSNILTESFRFHTKANMLGLVTDRLESLKYNRTLASPGVIEAVTDLHDLLVDSAKNGYEFDMEAWKTFGKQHGFNSAAESKPPYKSVKDKKIQSLVEKGYLKLNPESIGDFLVFTVGLAARRHFSQELREKYPSIDTRDGDLSRLSTDLVGSSRDPLLLIRTTEHLHAELKRIRDAFTKWNVNEAIEDRYKKASRVCHSEYKALGMECFPEHIRSEWAMRSAEFAPSLWECFKASVLFDRFHQSSKFCFAVAGSTLCYLKSFSTPLTNPVAGPMQSHIKWRPLKRDRRGWKLKTHERHDSTWVQVGGESDANDEFYDVEDAVAGLTEQFADIPSSLADKR